MAAADDNDTAESDSEAEERERRERRALLDELTREAEEMGPTTTLHPTTGRR